MPDFFYFIVFFVFGSIFGSFANVIIVRLPEKESIVPSSHCRKCQAKIPWYDNIPIISWLLRWGKCRQCQEVFSARYFIVELLMAILFVLAYLKLGLSFYLFEVLIFIFGAITASFIDLKHYILPDVFTLGGLVLALLGALINPERHFMMAFWGAMAGGGFLYLTAYIFYVVRKKEGMGGGDIKLLAWIGAIMGWQSIPVVLIFACITGTLFALLQSLFTKKSLQEGIPFGPFLCAGALFYVFYDAHTIVQWYLEVSGIQ